MIPFFAQAEALSAVPSEILKWVLVIAVTAVVVWGIVRKQKVEIDPQPMEVRKTPKRFNHDLAESRHTDHERRIGDLEHAMIGLETRLMEAGNDREKTLRTEIHEVADKTDASVLKVHDRINAVLQGVSRLEGKIEQMDKRR